MASKEKGSVTRTDDGKYPGISIKTEHGTISAYADPDPASMGIYICFTPEGGTVADEIDIASVEDPVGEDSVHIFDYADPYDEDWTQEHDLTIADILDALHLNENGG